MEPTFQVHAKIRKPIADVFAAVADPKKLSRYFTTGGASGPIVERSRRVEAASSHMV